MLKVLDFEALDDPEPTYRFTVEAVDEEGVMPPGLTSVTVTIKVGVWKHFFNVFYIAFYHHLFIFIIFIIFKNPVSLESSVSSPVFTVYC